MQKVWLWMLKILGIFHSRKKRVFCLQNFTFLNVQYRQIRQSNIQSVFSINIKKKSKLNSGWFIPDYLYLNQKKLKVKITKNIKKNSLEDCRKKAQTYRSWPELWPKWCNMWRAAHLTDNQPKLNADCAALSAVSYFHM